MKKVLLMKNAASLVVGLSLLFFAQYSFAQQRGFGLGIIIGQPTGISAKLWTSDRTAFDFGLGWSLEGNRRYNDYYNNGTSRVHFHMDYLWHSFNAISSAERFPLYYGVGGRLNSGNGYEASFAVRGVFGIAWLPRDTPLDVFLELVPVMQLTPSSSFGLGAGLGARYYF